MNKIYYDCTALSGKRVSGQCIIDISIPLHLQEALEFEIKINKKISEIPKVNIEKAIGFSRVLNSIFECIESEQSEKLFACNHLGIPIEIRLDPKLERLLTEAQSIQNKLVKTVEDKYMQFLRV